MVMKPLLVRILLGKSERSHITKVPSKHQYQILIASNGQIAWMDFTKVLVDLLKIMNVNMNAGGAGGVIDFILVITFGGWNVGILILLEYASELKKGVCWLACLVPSQCCISVTTDHADLE